MPGLIAFGFGQGAGVILATKKDAKHLGAVTLSLDISEPDVRHRIVAALTDLPASEPLMLVDWPRGCCVALSEADAIQRYARAST